MNQQTQQQPLSPEQLENAIKDQLFEALSKESDLRAQSEALDAQLLEAGNQVKMLKSALNGYKTCATNTESYNAALTEEATKLAKAKATNKEDKS